VVETRDAAAAWEASFNVAALDGRQECVPWREFPSVPGEFWGAWVIIHLATPTTNVRTQRASGISGYRLMANWLSDIRWLFIANPSQSYGASPAIWYHTVLPATRHRWARLV